MDENLLNFLLITSWANDPEAICARPCSSPEEAIGALQDLSTCSRHSLCAALVSNNQKQALSFFWHRFEYCAFPRPNWFRFNTVIKAFLSIECINEKEALDAAWEKAIKIVPLPIYEPLNIHLTPGEKLSLRSQEGIIPKWVQSSDGYVLWAISNITENSVCTSKRIIIHPANAGLYVKSTVYNTLASLRENEMVAEQWIESLRVYLLTQKGRKALDAMEKGYADAHLRRSARSLRIN